MVLAFNGRFLLYFPYFIGILGEILKRSLVDFWFKSPLNLFLHFVLIFGFISDVLPFSRFYLEFIGFLILFPLFLYF